MTEDEAWDEMERKQQKKKQALVTEREALRIAYNALIEIDKETPYPLAKHAAMVINSVLDAPAFQLDAIERAYFHGKQQGIAESEAINKMQKWDTSDMAHRPNGLTIDDDIQEYKKPWIGLTEVEVGKYSDRLNGGDIAREVEAKLKERNT
jgi:hypothetical protein